MTVIFISVSLLITKLLSTLEHGFLSLIPTSSHLMAVHYSDQMFSIHASVALIAAPVFCSPAIATLVLATFTDTSKVLHMHSKSVTTFQPYFNCLISISAIFTGCTAQSV